MSDAELVFPEIDEAEVMKQALQDRSTPTKPVIIRADGSEDEPTELDSNFQAIRMRVCAETCQHKEVNEDGSPGAPLYRVVDGNPCCGDPEAGPVNPHRMGVGGRIDYFAKWEQGACPRGLWGPGRKFNNDAVLFRGVPTEEKLKNTIDLVAISRHEVDMTGIGDVLGYGVLARSLRQENPDKTVRFVVSEGTMAWAKFSYDGIVIPMTGERIPAERVYHPSTCRFVDADRECETLGITRQEYWRRMVGVSKIELPHLRWNPYAPDPMPDMPTVMNEKKRLEIARLAGKPIIALSPFTNSTMRQWPQRHWMRLAELLVDMDCEVYVLDRVLDARTLKFVCTRYGGWGPQGIAALLEETDLVISNDSAMAHMAGLMDRTTLVIMSATNSKVVFNWYPTVHTIQAPGVCTGCYFQQDRGFRTSCFGGCELLMDLKPEAVVEHAREAEILR